MLADKINRLLSDNMRKRFCKLSKAKSEELWNAVKKVDYSCANNVNFTCMRDPDAVHKHFASIATSDDYKVDDVAKFLSESSDNAISLHEYEVEVLLRKCKKTSAGCDSLPAWLLRSCSYELAAVVSYIFDNSFVSGKVPSLWLCSVVTPVPKPSSLSDFRPISVTPILSRLAEKLVVTRWLRPHTDSCVIGRSVRL